LCFSAVGLQSLALKSGEEAQVENPT